MTISPEEIETRPFTPSADGYHQGEVRSFLARVAAELRDLQRPPESSAAPTPQMIDGRHFTAMLDVHQEQLAALNAKLDAVLQALRPDQTPIAKPEPQIDSGSAPSSTAGQIPRIPTSKLEPPQVGSTIADSANELLDNVVSNVMDSIAE